ncbi:mannosyltransferase [Roridomyces roridus]|uniref:Chitobiosyldiphosphodolichol beta-mannosyltransferase n=1 Tax=Roridomyces roridus TaxID=1738132 RepID=A0AAD7BTL6_9AGAR|nr:mannosyltransferase [Roridomyces roridus]
MIDMHASDYALVLLGATLVWLTWKFTSFVKPWEQHSLRSVAIVVLGDIGRSPRMMYHAESFADNDFVTDLIGYGGSKPIPSLEQHSKVKFNYLPEPPVWLRFLPFLISGPIKVVLQVCAMFLALFTIPNPPEFILVQNPPSIPTLAVVWAVSRMRGSKVIIDWHNLGYSILALRFKQGERHPLVRIAKWFEKTFGRTAYAHLFVTEAMREFLVQQWDLQGHKVVLHDRPPRRFHQATPHETHDLFAFKLRSDLYPVKDFLPASDPPKSTPLTTTTGSDPSPSAIIDPIYADVKAPVLRKDRPALLVSSTSWTPDEDFSILITALGQYNVRASAAQGKLPKVLVILTGKGPLRDKYMSEVGELQKEWEWVKCINMWLEAEDYPVLLGSADLGICLHTSSSKLDLPMKVVDMFGCGLPVCALHFECLHELVKDGKNGLVFRDASQLTEQIETLLTGFPSCPRLDELRSYLTPSADRAMSPPHLNVSSPEPPEDIWQPWDENWTQHIRRLILKDVK